MYTNVSLDEIQKKVKRLTNPFLKQLPYTWNEDIPYENYNGVNMTVNKNGGEILKIRKLQKVGKDGSGTYLYWGYIYNTPEETDNDIEDLDKYAFPVCFESYRRLTDISKDGDIQEIGALLKMLSREENFKKNNTIKYVGHLFKKYKRNEKGELEARVKYKRHLVSDSLAIQKQIEKLQREYKEKLTDIDNRTDNANAR